MLIFGLESPKVKFSVLLFLTIFLVSLFIGVTNSFLLSLFSFFISAVLSGVLNVSSTASFLLLNKLLLVL